MSTKAQHTPEKWFKNYADKSGIADDYANFTGASNPPSIFNKLSDDFINYIKNDCAEYQKYIVADLLRENKTTYALLAQAQNICLGQSGEIGTLKKERDLLKQQAIFADEIQGEMQIRIDELKAEIEGLKGTLDNYNKTLNGR